MLKVLYQAGLWVLVRLIPAAGLISKKVQKFHLSRSNEVHEFKEFERPEGKLYWFHCASLGEYEQAKPIIQDLENRDGNFTFITFFSPSGYEVIKPIRTPNRYVSYLPLEDKRAIRSFVQRVSPDKVFWVKYELWLLALEAVFKWNVPTYLVSANLGKGHFVTQFWALSWRKLLHRFTHIFVQNKESQVRLNKLGIDSIITGDTRFDNVQQVVLRGYENKKIEQWVRDYQLIVVGSSWEGEEEVLLPFLQENRNVKAIIAPHQIGESRITRLRIQLRELEIEHTLWDDTYSGKIQVIILNRIGLLSRVYKFANVAFVGGGYKKGLHNILEPMAWGKHVITGPNIENNWEAIEAKRVGLLSVAQSMEDFQVLYDQKIKEGTDATMASDFVSKHGAASKIILNNV